MRSIRNDDLLWIDIAAPNRDNMKELGRRFPFHELALEDCLSRIQIPKINRYSDHAFVILHFPIVQNNAIPKTSQLSVFVGSDYIVTIHQEEMDSLRNIFESCISNAAQRQTLMGKSSGYLFHTIVDALVDRFLDAVTSTRASIEEI